MTDIPDLAQLAAMDSGPERVKAACALLEELIELIEDVRRIRNADVRALAEQHGPTGAARLTGMSKSTVKSIRGTV